ncbi:MAG TPA: DUF1177 domain-containing protein [Anaerolineae bacterium]|nr:DUF1177 domain-containing protein [Anaerolineae bacterium]
MSMKQTMEIYELLDSAKATGDKVASLLHKRGLADVTVQTVEGPERSTDFVKAVIPGGEGPVLGIIGRLGGVGARPEMLGLVSDADGAIVSLATALKLADMRNAGDELPARVIVSTHVCPNAPVLPHEPVPFMNSPVDMGELLRLEVDPVMQAILSIDTTKGNRVINHKGFAISPTLKEGYILRCSEDLLDLMEIVTGAAAAVLPITTQDITPMGNGVYHLNSIMQPGRLTDAPVVALAITAESVVPGCASGASCIVDLEQAVRFCVEAAKAFGAGKCRFYDPEEFITIKSLYGSMHRLLES